MRISQLTDADLRRGLLWARQQAWIDEATKGLLDQALDKLAQDGSGGETAL